MVKHRLNKNKLPVKRVSQRAKISWEIFTLMLILATLTLIGCAAAADDLSIDPTLTISPTKEVTAVPTTIVVTGVTTVPVTQAPTTVTTTGSVAQAAPYVPAEQYKGAIPKTSTGEASYNAVLDQAFKDHDGHLMQLTKNDQRLEAAARAAEAAASSPEGEPGKYGAGAYGLTPVPGGVPDYFGPYPNYALSQLPTNTTVNNITTISGGIRKFVDTLPGLTAANQNNIGQYIPVAVSDTFSYPGDDYYIIAVVEYAEKMHSDIPNKSIIRGYVQLATPNLTGPFVPLVDQNGNPILYNGVQAQGVTAPHYLGPILVAAKDKPARIKFVNLLPTGVDGNLIIPVDTTIPGAGTGPLNDVDLYKENRATIHMHGGNTPWISDGTPHQWTVPANEATPYPKGVSTAYVPDMDGGNEPQGTMTFYYTNQQSARLLFYHDHAMGITRLNVYAGEASGYLITDPTTDALVANATIPTGLPVPLIIQDKTFVPDAAQMAAQDPTWNWGGNKTPTAVWPNTGSFWYPHVYMPAQNPADPSYVNAMGRWDYGPWTWPPYSTYINMPVANPYFINTTATPLEFSLMPGTPHPSQVPETFLDTPVVNGNPYPTFDVGQAAYRFEILNAAQERFWNLQWYIAEPLSVSVTNGGSGYSQGTVGVSFVGTGTATATATVDPVTGAVTAIDVTPGTSTFTTAPAVVITGANTTPASAMASVYTEVKMVPALPGTGLPASWPTDGRAGGVPDPTMVGPPMIQIGSEGGMLPAPVVIPAQPVVYETQQRSSAITPVANHSLFMGPAERANVIVDFSGYAPGTTFILYNDAPAPAPGFDDRYDFYTGSPDFTSIGGAPPTFVGLGPNTRTIMRVTVNASVTGPTWQGLAHLQATIPNAYAASQHAPIVPQPAYGAYPTNEVPLGTTNFSFTPVGGASPVTLDLKGKSVVEGFEYRFGRITALFGTEIAGSADQLATALGYGYADPPTEIFNNSIVGTQLIGTLGDGTQIWRMTHNGVDTHIVHWHMYDVQVLNRLWWDGTVAPTSPNELGWKESVKINALQDLIVAMRPIKPNVPWELKNSIRPLDPIAPVGSSRPMEFLGVDPNGTQVPVVNHIMNFGWEYVWHCHLLGHEEQDMMRTQSVAIAPNNSTGLVANLVSPTSVLLNWTDGSVSETAFNVQRATSASGPWNSVASVVSLTGPQTGANITYTDTSISSGQQYFYRVLNANLVGDNVTYNSYGNVAGYPNIEVYSAPTNMANTSMVGTTIGTFRGAGTWYVDFNGNHVWDGAVIDRQYSFGIAGDIPVANDWVRNGTKQIGTFRNGTWFADYNGNHVYDGPVIDRLYTFGTTGDKPIVGDWNLDGFKEIGVFRNGTWFVDFNANNAWDGAVIDRVYTFGIAGDIPVVSDWNHLGADEIGVFRNGNWFADFNGNNVWDGAVVDRVYSFGIINDKPVIGDWNIDGFREIGAFRNGTWFVDFNANNVWNGAAVDRQYTFGIANDKPFTL